MNLCKECAFFEYVVHRSTSGLIKSMQALCYNSSFGVGNYPGTFSTMPNTPACKAFVVPFALRPPITRYTEE